VGLVLTKARTRLVRAHCKVGKITKKQLRADEKALEKQIDELGR